MKNKTTIKLITSATLILLGGFTAGWATANTQVATPINRALLIAFNAVGKSLFGPANFAAIPTDPIAPSDPIRQVRIDFADTSPRPATFNVFSLPTEPTAPCESYLQVAVTGGHAVIKVDHDAAPEGFSTEIQSVSLAAAVPNTARCLRTAPPIVPHP